jgi:guanine deaminase
MTTTPTLPERPPFALRARILTPLARGGTRYEPDGRIEVDATGRIRSVGPWSGRADQGEDRPPGAAGESDGSPEAAGGPAAPPLIDLRPLVLLPGMVDLHVHLPQLPNAGVGAGLDLLTWLGRYIFPLEHAFDAPTAEVLAPAAFRAMAAAGTTTALMYGAVFEPSLDTAFRAAEIHGIRAIIGKVMMDRLTYDERLPADRILEVSLRQSADLCARWHGRDDGRLQYAFTPRFAISCTPDMLRESAALARQTGAYWQTHLSEDRDELHEVARLFPEAIDYLDVYDRAGGLGPRTVLAHAIHLAAREVERLVETDTAVAHCPASNLFLASGAMPLARYRAAGIRIGLGSDVAAGPELSILAVMRAGAYTQNGLRVLEGAGARPPLGPLDWLRLGSYEGARALGLHDRIGTLEPGKEADVIAVDPRLVAPLPGVDSDDPDEVVSRLIFRPHPSMVRAAWVRGRRLDGPPGLDGGGGDGAVRG